jgi:hypothetical protein
MNAGFSENDNSFIFPCAPSLFDMIQPINGFRVPATTIFTFSHVIQNASPRRRLPRADPSNLDQCRPGTVLVFCR